MADLIFNIEARWTGTGKEGEGDISAGGHVIHYSAPAAMGGRGVGTSPEELLLSAVTACYSGTLFQVLQKKKLPVRILNLQTTGMVEQYPHSAKFSRITVSPTIVGGDAALEDEYRTAAGEARDQCFIGRTVRDYLDYAVGTVTVH